MKKKPADSGLYRGRYVWAVPCTSLADGVTIYDAEYTDERGAAVFVNVNASTCHAATLTARNAVDRDLARLPEQGPVFSGLWRVSKYLLRLIVRLEARAALRRGDRWEAKEVLRAARELGMRKVSRARF